MNFGKWKNSDHEDIEQLKRIAKSNNIETPNVVDNERKTAIFESSRGSEYITNFDSCTCMDFSIRLKPCKHIYKLAIILGHDCDLPKLNADAMANFDSDEEILRFRNLYENGAISIDKFCKIADVLKKGK